MISKFPQFRSSKFCISPNSKKATLFLVGEGQENHGFFFLTFCDIFWCGFPKVSPLFEPYYLGIFVVLNTRDQNLRNILSCTVHTAVLLSGWGKWKSSWKINHFWRVEIGGGRGGWLNVRWYKIRSELKFFGLTSRLVYPILFRSARSSRTPRLDS